MNIKIWWGGDFMDMNLKKGQNARDDWLPERLVKFDPDIPQYVPGHDLAGLYKLDGLYETSLTLNHDKKRAVNWVQMQYVDEKVFGRKAKNSP